ncbi:hypothetical protein, partial [Salmonella sp. LS2020043sal]|uniref:hypothetical protein n=1 Tax=Salmonella sp. LS2020043sal TaxID=3159624 RepID=UPI00397E3D85
MSHQIECFGHSLPLVNKRVVNRIVNRVYLELSLMIADFEDSTIANPFFQDGWILSHIFEKL